MTTSRDFLVVCFAGRYKNDWLVVRKRDHRIMTQGDVLQCLRWVDVWGPVLGDKPGKVLAERDIATVATLC